MKNVYGHSFPQLDIYNSNGDLVSSGACFMEIKPTLDSLYNTSMLNVRIDDFANMKLKNINRKNYSRVAINYASYDYTLVYYWAKWMGRLNKTRLRFIERKIKMDRRKKIQLVKVNIDFLEEWSWTKNLK